uniref:Protein sleepless n=1 Tax=Clastoptera arizonana TaxID=38151 RepID=A0A1B6E2A0_9HEMI
MLYKRKEMKVVNIILLYIFFFSIQPLLVGAVIKRCFKCRSRSDLGSCKDPFNYNNASALENVHGVQAIPCASGWCGKVLERGANTFKDEEYGVATERLCLQRGPSDDEERCAPTVLAYTKTYGRNI